MISNGIPRTEVLPLLGELALEPDDNVAAEALRGPTRPSCVSGFGCFGRSALYAGVAEASRWGERGICFGPGAFAKCSTDLTLLLDVFADEVTKLLITFGRFSVGLQYLNKHRPSFFSFRQGQIKRLGFH